MQNYLQTEQVQWADSPILSQMLNNMNQYFDPTTNFDNFYNYVWNVATAQGFGLDFWGDVVGVSRYIPGNFDNTLFGFQPTLGTLDVYPFGQGVFNTTEDTTPTFALSDDAYRILILAKALANISATTAPALNQILLNMFPGRGAVFVNDLGQMRMRYTFLFALQPYELAILTSGIALPRPAGVLADVANINMPHFGFAEAGDATPWGTNGQTYPFDGVGTFMSSTNVRTIT
jgi:hypothetical protein